MNKNGYLGGAEFQQTRDLALAVASILKHSLIYRWDLCVLCYVNSSHQSFAELSHL